MHFYARTLKFIILNFRGRWTHFLIHGEFLNEVGVRHIQPHNCVNGLRYVEIKGDKLG